MPTKASLSDDLRLIAVVFPVREHTQTLFLIYRKLISVINEVIIPYLHEYLTLNNDITLKNGYYIK